MATIIRNEDETLTVVLNATERATYDALPAGAAESIFSLYLRDQAKESLGRMFEESTDQEKATVLAALRPKATPRRGPGQ